MQVTFGYMLGFPIDIAALSNAAFVLLLLPRVALNVRVLVLVGGFALYALAMGYAAADKFEFAKSYALLFNLLLTIAITTGEIDLSNVRLERALSYVRWAGAVVAVVIILQAVFWNGLEVSWLRSPLGPLTPLGPGRHIYVPGEIGGLYRPNGVFSEPSIAGWMMGYLAALAWLSECQTGGKSRRSCFEFALFSIAGLMTVSLSGILSVIGVWAAVIINVLRRATIRAKWLLATVVGTALVVGLLISWQSSAYLGDRLEHAGEPGTSIYYRIVAPVKLLRDSLPEYPLGHPVGQVEYIKHKDYMTNWVKGSSTNIDNSAFFVMYYFGAVGVLIVVGVIGYVGLLTWRGLVIAPVAVAQLMAALSTGALWSPWIVMMLAFSIIIGRWANGGFERRIPMKTDNRVTWWGLWGK